MSPLHSFRSPPPSVRPCPLWVFNATLSRAEISRQIRALKAAGFGGFFIHPRIGLEVRFLSEDWMDLVAHCIREAKRHGLSAWLYDEDRWPSGFAGGLLLDRHPEFRVRGLVWGTGANPAAARRDSARRTRFPRDAGGLGDPGAEVPFIDFAIRRLAGRWTWRRLPRNGRRRVGERVLSFIERAEPDSNWFGGRAYADLLNPAAVRALLQTAWQPYAKRFRGEFGRAIPGVFTDEPMIRSWYIRGLPWTPGFDRVLARELPGGLDSLPELALTTPASPAARHAFMRALAERFRESFARQVGDWTRRHGLALTGHWLDEDRLWSQAWTAGALMPLYEHQGMPGIDHLRRQAGHRLTMKQVSSAARQLGKPAALSELYGVTGHSLSFADQKWIGDWHLVNGVGFFCHHLVLQTMAGDRKRDYPPTFSWHQPWWRDLRLPNDYFSRIAAELSKGKAVSRILVLHPIASIWAVMEWDREPNAAKRIDAGLNALMDALATAHRDFDLGDETLLERHATITHGRLVVGQALPYDAVIVPPSTNWCAGTVDRLERLVAAGIPVIFAGTRPGLIDGQPATKRWSRLARSARRLAGFADPRALDAVLAAAGVPRDVVTRHDPDLAIQHRLDGSRHLYFFMNRDRKRGKRLPLILEGAGRVERLVPETGSAIRLPSSVSPLDGRPGSALTLDLAPGGSVLVTIDPRRPEHRAAIAPARSRMILKLGRPESVFPTEPNLLVLDRCKYRVDGRGADHRPVLEARSAAFRATGLQQFNGLQPWRLRDLGLAARREPNVLVEYQFHSARAFAGLHAVIESPDAWSITLNDRPLDPAPGSPWRGDPRLIAIPLGLAVRAGANTLRLSGSYRPGVEIEDVFITGNFTITGPAAGPLTLAPFSPPRLGDWTKQGFRFYPGAMTYRFDARVPATGRWTLRLGRGSAAVYRVRVDARRLPPVGWAPWEADLGRLTAGRHRIEVDAVSSLQNAFGPLHNTRWIRKGDDWWVGPDSFSDPDGWTDRYLVRPYGLFQPPALLRKD